MDRRGGTLVAGAEYRRNPDNLCSFGDDDYWDPSAAWFPAKQLLTSRVPRRASLETGPRQNQKTNLRQLHLAQGTELRAGAEGDVAAARSHRANAGSRGATPAPLRLLERRLASG